MKKILNQLTIFLLFLCISGCAGYEPIFTSVNMKLQIKEHSVSGEKKIAKQLDSITVSKSLSSSEERSVLFHMKSDAVVNCLASSH